MPPCAQDATWFAYFTPYPLPRHTALVAATQVKPRVRLEVLGPTLDGRDVDLLHIGAACSCLLLCYFYKAWRRGSFLRNSLCDADLLQISALCSAS